MSSNRQSEVVAACQDVDFDANEYQIELNTNHGRILLNLLSNEAPGHCNNMIGLTRIGFYDGVGFHRIIDGFMIQGGCPLGNGTGDAGYKINAEFNQTPHVPGVLSMARSQSPDSAGSQFFICTGAHSHLDGQYTAFGRAADEASMAVVSKIGSLPTGASDRPREPVVIESASVVVTPRG